MTKAAVAEHNPVEVPLYTPLDVARHLRAPAWLVVAMWRGCFPPRLEMFFHWLGRRLIPIDRDGDMPDVPELRERWSFRNFADLYIFRLFAVESLLEIARGEPEEGGRAGVFVEPARSLLAGRFPVPIFFSSASPAEGIACVLQTGCMPLLAEERMWLEKRLVLCLGRFDMDGDAPCRLYPFSRVPAENSPRIIVMDPRIRFGRPTVRGHGTPTDILLERHQAGDSIAELADELWAPAGEVEEAIRYEAMPLILPFSFFGW